MHSIEVLEYWNRAGWVYYRAKALVDYPDAEANGDANESRRTIEEIISIFRKLGAKLDLHTTELN